jgi:proline iminopeptidase
MKIYSTLFSLVLLMAPTFCFASQQPPQNNPDSKASLLAPGEHYASILDVNIWYRVAGHGPLLIVMSPQWGIGSTYLQNGISPLEKHFTVVYLDARGNEKSSRPADATRMSTSDMTDDLEDLRAYWGLQSLDLLGHSGGGGIILGYAERYPEHASKLVLIDSDVTDIYPSPASKRFEEKRRNDPRYARAMAHFNDPTPTDDASFQKNLFETLAWYLNDPEKYVPVLKNTLAGTDLSLWAHDNWWKSEQVHPVAQSVDLNLVRAKTLILVGREDPECPVVMSETIHSGILGSKLIIFEKTGHFPWIESREKFFSVVSQFLSSQAR